MKRILAFLQRIENAILVGTFIVMVVTFFCQVVNRNIFKAPISWFEEAATYCMIYMVLLGTEVGLRDGTQIAVTAVVDKTKGKAKILLQILAKAIVELFSVAMLLKAVEMVRVQVISGQTSASLHLPMWVPYSALLLSFGIISLVQGASLALLVSRLFGAGEGESDKGVKA